MQFEATTNLGAGQPPATTTVSPAANEGLAPAAPATPARLRTVIVDDDTFAREVLRRLLQKEGDVELVGVAAGSREGVDLINQLKPDLVFLDIQMPDLDGFEVLGQVRCPRAPAVVFVTSNAEFAQHAGEVQALDFVVKPCTRQRLQTVLQRARERLGQPVSPEA